MDICQTCGRVGHIASSCPVHHMDSDAADKKVLDVLHKMTPHRLGSDPAEQARLAGAATGIPISGGQLPPWINDPNRVPTGSYAGGPETAEQYRKRTMGEPIAYMVNDPNRVPKWGSATPYETVDHPKHYNAHPAGIECIDVIEDFPANIAFAIKYLWRAGLKPGVDPQEDLDKAVWYLKREQQRLRKREEIRP